MTDRFEGLKRVLEAAVNVVTTPSRHLKGRDFMRDDLTLGAEYGEY